MPIFRGSKDATVSTGDIVATQADIANAVTLAEQAQAAAEAAATSAAEDVVSNNLNEIRDLFSASGDLNYNSTTGEFSFSISQNVGTTSDVTFNSVTANNVNPNIITVAAGKFNSDGTTANASGISCTKVSTGHYSISFSSARPDSEYIVIGQVIEPDTQDDVKIHVRDATQTANGFDVYIYEGDNANSPDTNVDRSFYIVVHDTV